MRAFSTDFAGRDLGFLDRPGALDVALPHLALRGDARGIDRALIGDLGLFDFLARQQFLFLHRARALDLAVTGLAFGGDAGFGDRLFVGDAGLLDGLAGGNLRLFGLGLAQRALARHLGALQRPAHLDVAFLVEAGGLALALDLQRLTLGIEVAGADLDHRILFDVVAQLALGLDVLHQAGQALGVEPVRRVEIFEVGLIEIGDRDQLQLKPVLGERFGGGGLEPRDVFAALLVHLFHGHFGGHRTYGRDELAGEQGVQLLGFERAPSERRGGDRDRLAGRLHADVKVGLDVDTHAVAGDHRVMLGPNDAHRQHVHVDGRVVVNERQHEGAAVDHDAFAEQTGSHKGHFLRRTVVQPVHDVDDDGDHDDRNDQPEDQFANQSPRHLFLPLVPALSRADRLEFTNLFRQCPLHRQALHRGGAVEAVALARVFHDEVGIRRLGDRAAMGQHQYVRIDAERGRGPGVDLFRTVLEFRRGVRPDRAAGGQAEMADDDVRACDRHRRGLAFAEHVGCRQHVLVTRLGDHVDLQRIGHSRLFQIGAEDAVDQPDGRKVLHAGKAQRLQLEETGMSYALGSGMIDAGGHPLFSESGGCDPRHAVSA